MSKRPPSLTKSAKCPETPRAFSLDRPLHAAAAQLTAGISPAALALAFTDWAQHLVFSPDKQIELAEMAVRNATRHVEYCVRACREPNCARCIAPLPQDKRFTGEAWQKWLVKHSSGQTAPPPMGAAKGYRPLGDAPGAYVLEP